MALDEQTGAPSTPEQLDAAQDAALATNDFARYAEVENAREANKALPEAPPPSKETSDKTTASETVAEKEIQEKRPKTGEDRKVELKNEIAELLRQRAELQGKTAAVTKVEPATTVEPVKVAPVKAEAASEAPKKPSVNDFATYGEYEAANDAYIADLVTYKAAELIAAHDTKRETEAAQRTYQEAWVKKVAEAKAEFSDFEAVAFNPNVNLGPIAGVMMQFLKTKAGANEARVLYKLGENDGAEAKRILALDPFDQVEALVGIKQSLGSPTKKEEVTTPVKRHTAAPPPATSLGGNATDIADAGEASLAGGDFASYMAKANAAEKKAAAR